MKKHRFAIFLMILSLKCFDVFSCEISSCENILILNQNPSKFPLSNILRSKNCTIQQEMELLEFIQRSNGKISRSILREYFPLISLVQNQIFINSIESLILSRFSSKNFSLTEIKTFSPKNILCLDNSTYKITCENCNSVGLKTFHFALIASESHFNFTGQTIFKQTLKAYTVLNAVQPGELIGPGNVVELSILTDNPGKYLQNDNGIEFYSANKKINTKDPIGVNDVSPASVVTYGKSLKVILKNGPLSLVSDGKSMGSAQFGQPVQVNINGKISTGKATNFNEVTLDL